MSTNIVDLYPYATPEGFHAGTSFSGTFINVFIANQDNMKLPPDHPAYNDKPKYAFSCAVPYENKKTFVREVQTFKFFCTEDDFNFLKSVYESIKFQPVHFLFICDSWGVNARHGLFYRYVSDSIQRFDGKQIVAGGVKSSQVNRG